jgi:hypothetical protein
MPDMLHKYAYSKAGKVYQVVGRSATDARIQIEIPAMETPFEGC